MKFAREHTRLWGHKRQINTTRWLSKRGRLAVNCEDGEPTAKIETRDVPLDSNDLRSLAGLLMKIADCIDANDGYVDAEIDDCGCEGNCEVGR